jgi:hypothetical protein
MSALLDDIIRLAQDDKESLPNLLRKCLILASQLKNDRLKKWANQELDGYESGTDEDIPAYRKIHASAYGSFAGPFNSWSNKHIIIPSAMKEQHRPRAETMHLIQSVSALDNLVKSVTTNAKEVLAAHWPPDMIAYYSDILWEGWICHDAWQEIGKSTLVGVLDAVRNITLRMALDIKDELGTSFDDLSKIKPEEIERVKNVVINNLGGNVALGDLDASGSTVIIAGDRKTLDAALTKAGLDSSDLNELSDAILVDGGSKPGTAIDRWFSPRQGRWSLAGSRSE